MGLLRRKPKVSIEEFCQQFYDSPIFNPVISGEDVYSDFWEGVFNSIVEDDRSFVTIDQTLFRREIITLRIELFGLAWMHHIQLEEYLMPEILFTKHYLQENEKLEIWDSMADYNQAIAQGMEILTKPVRRDFEPVARFEDVQQASITFMKELRADMFDKWVKETGDSE